MLVFVFLLGCAPAMAVDLSVSGKNTVTDGSASSLVTVEMMPVQMTVTVPSVLPATINARGVTTVAPDAAVINQSSGPVEVTGIKAKAISPWTLVGPGYNFAAAKVNSKLVQVSINGQAAAETGNLSLTEEWVVPAWDSLGFGYSVKISAQRTALTDVNMAEVEFTVDWYKEKFIGNSLDWEYTLNEATNTITLTKYIGESTDVTVYNEYQVGDKTYKNVVMGTSTSTNGPFVGSPKKAELTSVTFLKGVSLPANVSYMFYNCSKLAAIDMTKISTNNVTNMSHMFHSCFGLKNLDVSNFNTGRVTSMESLFSGCRGLTSLDVSNFDTSNVTNMNSMFGNINNGCSNLTSLDLTNFNTSKVKNMGNMFYNCSKLTSLNITNLDTSNVTDMSDMFSHCSKLTSLDVTHFNTGKVTNMDRMFQGCSSLTSLDVSHFDTRNVTGMYGIFYGCSNIKSLNITNFNTSKIRNMSYMFAFCYSLASLDVTNFDTSNVTQMGNMFSGCYELTSLDVSNFNTSKVTYMYNMFNCCFKLTSLDVSNFDTSNVTNMGGMFKDCRMLATIYASDAFTTDKVTSSDNMFTGCSKLVGGNGTKCDGNSSIGSSRARIDTPDTPGYFTAKTN